MTREKRAFAMVVLGRSGKAPSRPEKAPPARTGGPGVPAPVAAEAAAVEQEVVVAAPQGPLPPARPATAAPAAAPALEPVATSKAPTEIVKYDPSFAKNQQGIPGGTHTIPTASMTAEEAAAAREYAARVNAHIEATGQPLIRQPTKGPLRAAASGAARRERLRAERAGQPYKGQAGHVPDATWTGKAEPPAGWQDMPGVSNNAIGGTAGQVPVGTVVNHVEVK